MFKTIICILGILLLNSLSFSQEISLSDEAFKKFQSISEEYWLNLFTKITEGKFLKEKEQELEWSAYSESAKKGIVEMDKESINEMQKYIDEIQGKTLREKAQNLTSEIMTNWRNAFLLSDAEAKKLFSGKYDDVKNMEEIQKCLDVFAGKEISIPFIFRILGQEVYHKSREPNLENFISYGASRKFADSELSPMLEFTARLFMEHREQISK